jgi:hypothetical protein
MLNTLRIVPKPEETAPYWDIHRARGEEEPDYEVMIAWFKAIEEIRRTKLNIRDPIHNIVHDMLNINRSQRLTATQVHARARHIRNRIWLALRREKVTMALPSFMEVAHKLQ